MERYVKEKQQLAGCSHFYAEGQIKPGLLDCRSLTPMRSLRGSDYLSQNIQLQVCVCACGLCVCVVYLGIVVCMFAL